jgi:phosphatidylglycerophosphate synthase
MAKLAAQDKFLDLSDYGRPIAIRTAELLKNTKITPVQVTLVFGLCGLLAAYCIVTNHFVLAGILLVLKSIIDAIDGELARAKNTPSYTGRYLDSVFDIIINLIVLLSICSVSATNLWLTLCAFICVQLQGTLYNYYYVILRNIREGGDTTSKIFEYKSPKAFESENQKTVDLLFMAYTICYGVYDKFIHFLDQNAYKSKNFPNWFMTLVSLYGLGFQLLIIALMLPFGLKEYIIPFFIGFSSLIFIIIGIRKAFL